MFFFLFFYLDRMASRDSRVERTVVCSTCGETGHQEDVIQHALKEHFKRSSIPWICPEGDYITHVRGKMWNHRKNVHGSDNSEVLTETCSGSHKDMSPDAFIKPENARVMRNYRDLSEPLNWGTRKRKMKWHWEPPATRSWSEASGSGRAQGDRRQVEVSSPDHHRDRDRDGERGHRRSTSHTDKTRGYDEETPDSDDARTKRRGDHDAEVSDGDHKKSKRSKKDKKRKRDKKKSEAELSESDDDQRPPAKRDDNLYTPDTVPMCDKIVEGANYSDDQETDIQAQPAESTSTECLDENKPSEEVVAEQGLQEMRSPLDVRTDATLTGGMNENQALVDQMTYTRQRIKEGNGLLRAMQEDMKEIPQQMGEVVQELKKMNQTLSDMYTCMRKQLEIADFQLRIEAKLGVGRADAYKAWKEYCTYRGAEKDAEADSTGKAGESAEGMQSPQENTD